MRSRSNYFTIGLTDLVCASDDNTPSIAGPLMAQYLMTLLASRGMAGQADLFGPAGLNFMMGGGVGAENGRWGDYVFNQEGMSKR